tara:strand:- start:41371 stop:41766 length:396 start_codon:yes stop_codon:yes gene_type:complete
MAKLKDIRMDLSDNVEIEYEAGIKVHLRPMPNPDFDAYMQKLRKPELRKIRKNALSADETSLITKRAMAATVVVGWTNLEADDGTPIKFSPEECLKLFVDPELYDFYQFCRTESSDIGNFRKEVEADAVGN